LTRVGAYLIDLTIKLLSLLCDWPNLGQNDSKRLRVSRRKVFHGRDCIASRISRVSIFSYLITRDQYLSKRGIRRSFGYLGVCR